MVYANSVLGARCNRNSGIIDIMGSIVGYVPYFGLLTDEGRKATWVVKIKTSKKPEAQLLGKALCLPQTIGSTTGGLVLYCACSMGKNPACMLFAKPLAVDVFMYQVKNQSILFDIFYM